MIEYVIKRDGSQQEILFEKISARIQILCKDLDVSHVRVSKHVIQGICSGITTVELDKLASDYCSILGNEHPDYHTLAARIFVSNLHKETCDTFTQAMETVESILDPEFMGVVRKYSTELNEMIKSSRDYDLTFFGLKTLERAYLLRNPDGLVAERPGYLLLRVALALHTTNMERVRETYDLMSKRHFIHATPTLFNAGTRRQGLASCFLLSASRDSIEGIYEILGETAVVSKYSGGVGLSVHDIRATGSRIRSVNGVTGGLKPMLRVFNQTASHVTQAGKRPGSIAVYLEPWHADIMDFLDLRLPTGKEENRARDLFYALWIPDLFMERAQADGQWTLFCPGTAPGLSEVYGDEFKSLYERYEKQGLGTLQIPAKTLMEKIGLTRIRTGMPYCLFKDTVNRLNNQRHYGVIKSSNLCCEITLYSDEKETAVCNLGSLGLPSFVKNGVMDFDSLGQTARVLTRNLDITIDKTLYPGEKARYSNMKHRPIGLGVSGLADTFMMLRLPFDSPGARQLNKDIFECIYYHALDESCRLAQLHGHYSSFPGSEFSKGNFQFDLTDNPNTSSRWDWTGLRKRVMEFGTRNCQLTAIMPTASTSQILGYSECIEPINSNLYKRQTISGEFEMVNKYLLADLRRISTTVTVNDIIRNRGSLEGLDLPQDLKDLYRVSWDMSQRILIDLAVDRAKYIDQSQSMNLFFQGVTTGKLEASLVYAWKAGLKTGVYYTRQKVAAAAVQITVKTNPSNDGSVVGIGGIGGSAVGGSAATSGSAVGGSAVNASDVGIGGSSVSSAASGGSDVGDVVCSDEVCYSCSA